MKISVIRVYTEISYLIFIVFFFKQKTAYEIKECDWSSDVCSSDLQKMPEEADRLHKLLVDWRKRVGAQMPTKNPAFRSAKK